MHYNASASVLIPHYIISTPLLVAQLRLLHYIAKHMHLGRVTKRGIVVLIVALSVVVVCVAIAEDILDSVNGNSRPRISIPATITSGLSFTVYYPIQKKLPKGYTFNTGSFSRPLSEGINYTISYEPSQTVVFSLQPKPSSESLQTFEASYIPLRNSYETSIGQAELGAYNIKGKTKTLVSLIPTQSNTWIIITAPYNISQDQLKQILNSLQKY